MSLIEQAARRLEELRRAGTEATPQLEPGSPPAVEVRAASPAALAGPSRAAPVKLNLAKLAAEGYLTPDVPRSRIAEEFRVIKRPLIANATGNGAKPIRNGNLIMVTSAVNGEGKSFTAANLAMSIALEPDRTVLLVDADVAQPSLPRTFGISEYSGLLDVLNKSVDLEEVLHPTNVDKLAFMFSGRPHARATEMLASDAMSALLNDLAARHPERIVVFDSPPLLDATEARVLATRMGQIVFVVDAESTLQADVKHALASIEACPTTLTVLNKAKTAAQGAYGYGYGYGHGH